MDIAKLASTAVRFFNEKPVIAMVSHSNFGSNTSDGAKKVKYAVEEMQQLYPDLPIDGEMQLGFALDNELRDEEYPFTKVCGKKVNTLVFPNLTSARSSYKMLQMLGTDAEIIGPIQMGLNKPIQIRSRRSSTLWANKALHLIIYIRELYPFRCSSFCARAQAKLEPLTFCP